MSSFLQGESRNSGDSTVRDTGIKLPSNRELLSDVPPMSSFLQGDSRNSGDSTVRNTGIELPSNRELLSDVPQKRSFHDMEQETLQNTFVQHPSSFATSQSIFERGMNQKNLLSVCTTTSPNTGDQASNEGTASMDEIPVYPPMTLQDPFEEAESQVQYMGTVSVGESSRKLRKLDKGKGRDDQAEGLAVIPGLGYPHTCDNTGKIVTNEGRDISYNRSPDIWHPPEQESTRVYTQGVGSHLHGAHHFMIGGNPRFENNAVKNEYNYPNPGEPCDIPILKEFVSLKALYDSSAQDPTRRVHPGTRQRILKSIRDWIDTPNTKERIFWLHGPAGVGKSAIAQTIARSCSREQLVATFFFFRSDPTRNDGNRLFTTLAWQIAFAIPATKNIIIRALHEHPDIPTKEVEAQFEELIVKPVLALKRSGIDLPAPVVIIDGVDECSDDSLQRRLLKIIGNGVKDDRIPFRFLICSRSEAHIQDTINIFQSLTLPFDLAATSGLHEYYEDIKKYLRAEFSRIASEQDLDPTWPGEKIIGEFIYKACGQFIYASTVIKYVGDEFSSAKTQLDIIHGLKLPLNISPFTELDELYTEILRRQRDPVFIKNCLSLLIGRNHIGPDELYEDEVLLMNVTKQEFYRKLRGMHSLLDFRFSIDVHHRSFLDFLQDPSRSGLYHISKRAGTRRYLDMIVASIVRCVSDDDELYDHHGILYSFSFPYQTGFGLSLEEWQQALQPILEFQNLLLTLPKSHHIWEKIACIECDCFDSIRNLLIRFTLFMGFGCISSSSLLVAPHIDKSEQMKGSSIPFRSTEGQMDALAENLDDCLSSLLFRLRRKILGISLDVTTIKLFCFLIRFDPVETAEKLQCISDGQNMIDLIDELINKHCFSDYGQDIPQKAVQLALEISDRILVLPRSLFSKGTVVGPHHHTFKLHFGRSNTLGSLDIEPLFQTAILSRVLDSSYVVRVSSFSLLGGLEEEFFSLSVFDEVDMKNEPLSEWQKHSNTTFLMKIRVMLKVAKAIRYFHAMGVLLHREVELDYIFLDAELHPRFIFRGLAEFCNFNLFRSTPPITREENVFHFGCLFYELCFDGERTLFDRLDKDKKFAIFSKRPTNSYIHNNEWQLIQRCCTEDERHRPSMDDIVREMETWDIEKL